MLKISHQLAKVVSFGHFLSNESLRKPHRPFELTADRFPFSPCQFYVRRHPRSNLRHTGIEFIPSSVQVGVEEFVSYPSSCPSTQKLVESRADRTLGVRTHGTYSSILPRQLRRCNRLVDVWKIVFDVTLLQGGAILILPFTG